MSLQVENKNAAMPLLGFFLCGESGARCEYRTTIVSVRIPRIGLKIFPLSWMVIVPKGAVGSTLDGFGQHGYCPA